MIFKSSIYFWISSGVFGTTEIWIWYPVPNFDLMCCLDPKHLNSPSTIIPILVDRASASSIEWVVKITAEFFLWVDIRAMTFHMNLQACGSIPADGSSRKITGGLPIMQIATLSFHLFPPESFPAALFQYSVRFISQSCCSTRFLWYLKGIHLIQA